MESNLKWLIQTHNAKKALLSFKSLVLTVIGQ